MYLEEKVGAKDMYKCFPKVLYSYIVLLIAGPVCTAIALTQNTAHCSAENFKNTSNIIRPRYTETHLQHSELAVKVCKCGVLCQSLWDFQLFPEEGGPV